MPPARRRRVKGRPTGRKQRTEDRLRIGRDDPDPDKSGLRPTASGKLKSESAYDKSSLGLAEAGEAGPRGGRRDRLEDAKQLITIIPQKAELVIR